MQKTINKIVIAFLICFVGLETTAQNSTNSPYTRYGYGELANRSFGAGRSMGGVGIGLRSPRQINPMNPASYSCMDSLTFLFDFGASAQLSWFSDANGKQNDLNGNVEYMAMQFPLHRKAAMSVGLMPYSHVGYKFGEAKKSAEGLLYSEQFEGVGGLNLLYAGLSIDIWKKRLSVGANINYLFGSITHSSQSIYSYESPNATSVNKTVMFKIKNATFDLGAQYTHRLSKTENMVFGLKYSPKMKLSNETYQSISSTTSVIDTLTGLAYDKPVELGAGISYIKTDKLTIAADIDYQKWSDVWYAGKSEQFDNRLKIAAGAEWIPNLYSRPFFNRVRYRTGASYTGSYVKINGRGYNELSFNLGAGFPITDGRSYINVSFDYVKITPEIKTMIDEQYFRMTISYTFNEYWFFKKKLE